MSCHFFLLSLSIYWVNSAWERIVHYDVLYRRDLNNLYDELIDCRQKFRQMNLRYVYVWDLESI